MRDELLEDDELPQILPLALGKSDADETYMPLGIVNCSNGDAICPQKIVIQMCVCENVA